MVYISWFTKMSSQPSFSLQESLTTNIERGLSLPNTGVKGNGTQRPDAIVYGPIADESQERGEFGRAEKAGDRFREIGVGGLMTGDEPANSWQNFRKVPAV